MADEDLKQKISEHVYITAKRRTLDFENNSDSEMSH